MNGPALDHVAQPGEAPQVAAQRREAGILKSGEAELEALRAFLDDGVAAGPWVAGREGDVLVWSSATVAHEPTVRAAAVADHSTRAGQSE